VAAVGADEMTTLVVRQAATMGLAACHICEKVVRMKSNGHGICPRCHSHVHFRKPHSLSRCWAFLIGAILMYIPANALPIMKTTYFGTASTDTIMSGVVYFIQHGDWPLAVVIFTASVLVPLSKMMAIIYLLLSVHRRSPRRSFEKTFVYKVTEFVGRWSMVDVFVVALLAALVQIGAVVTITPDWGALAFAAVVILTMFSAMAFDPRLIWDSLEQQNDVV
jgi:paraquat-inducible protein A